MDCMSIEALVSGASDRDDLAAYMRRLPPMLPGRRAMSEAERSCTRHMARRAECDSIMALAYEIANRTNVGKLNAGRP